METPSPYSAPVKKYSPGRKRLGLSGLCIKYVHVAPCAGPATPDRPLTRPVNYRSGNTGFDTHYNGVCSLPADYCNTDISPDDSFAADTPYG